MQDVLQQHQALSLSADGVLWSCKQSAAVSKCTFAIFEGKRHSMHVSLLS